MKLDNAFRETQIDGETRYVPTDPRLKELLDLAMMVGNDLYRVPPSKIKAHLDNVVGHENPHIKSREEEKFIQNFVDEVGAGDVTAMYDDREAFSTVVHSELNGDVDEADVDRLAKAIEVEGQ